MSMPISFIKEQIEASRLSSKKEHLYPQNYAKMAETAFKEEFKKNCKSLTSLFKWSHSHPELLKENFMKLCLAREQKIQNTCFSFTATPHSLSNALYWFIAYNLFEPKTLKEICRILLPSIKTFLSIDIGYYQDNNRHHPAIIFEELDLLTSSCLEEPLIGTENPEQFGHYVFADGVVFPTNSIQHFNFTHHKACYKALERKYPQIHQKLYQYTDETKLLASDIEQYECIGVTPKEKLTRFMRTLLLSGAHYTNNHEEASLEASFAFKEFQLYLDALPNKEELLEMENDNNVTLRMVIDNLKKPDREAGCVEMNADHIKHILQNPSNETLLVQLPVLSQERKQTILERYRNQSMLIFGTEQTNKIPKNILKILFENIIINREIQLVEFLVNLSEDEYPLLFNHAILRLDETWGRSIFILPKEKRIALRKLLLEDYDAYSDKNKTFINTICELGDNEYESDSDDALENAPVDEPRARPVLEPEAQTSSNAPSYILTAYILLALIGNIFCFEKKTHAGIYWGILEVFIGFVIYAIADSKYNPTEIEPEENEPSAQARI